MKKFGDLTFGDVLYVGFSKKKVLYIEPDPYSKDNIIIWTSDYAYYKVSPNVSFDYFIDLFIASDKEVIVNHFVEKLHELGYESTRMTRMYYEYLLKLAKEL